MSRQQQKLSELLSTSNSLAHLQWSMLLELQVSVFFPAELQVLLTSPQWRGAHRVLDAGCGNGYYLSHLKNYFPEKKYVGLDLSHEHIAAARYNPLLQDVALHYGDFFTFEAPERFDAVIMRLIIQHMSGLDSIIKALERLVRPGGTVFVIEPEPDAFLSYPSTPKFVALLRDYERRALALRSNRGDLVGLMNRLPQLYGWSVAQNTAMIVPRAGSFGDNPILKIFSLWLDIFQRSGSVDSDFDAVRSELEAWSALPHAYNQIGFRMIELQRNPQN